MPLPHPLCLSSPDLWLLFVWKALKMIFWPLHMRGLGPERESTFPLAPRGLAGVQEPVLLLTLDRFVTLSNGGVGGGGGGGSVVLKGAGYEARGG